MNAFGVVDKRAETKKEKRDSQITSAISGAALGSYAGYTGNNYVQMTRYQTRDSRGNARWTDRPQNWAIRRAMGTASKTEKPNNPNFDAKKWEKLSTLAERASTDGEKASAQAAKERMAASGRGPMKHGGMPRVTEGKSGSKMAAMLAPHLKPHRIRQGLVVGAAAGVGGGVYALSRRADKKRVAKLPAKVKKNAFGVEV